jgi:hypothetical protein
MARTTEALLRDLRESRTARVLRCPSAVLLFVQLAGVLLYPLMEDAAGGRTLFNVFGLVVLAAALRVVRRSPRWTWLALLLALPLVVLLLVNMFAPSPQLTAVTAALEAAFYFYATGSLIAYMQQDAVATTDELFCVAATFTLLAWAFAHLYTVCEVLAPGSFSAQFGARETRTWLELLFLSFTTLTAVGLSDIVPVRPMARALVMLEQLAGLMYIALVVARLIGLTIYGGRIQTEGDKKTRAQKTRETQVED